MRTLWLAVCVALGAVASQYLLYAASALVFPFGLDYSEGLMWQQALWLGGPHLYGETAHFPFLVCDYPPLYLIAVRAAGLFGFSLLHTGRAISVLSTLATCLLLGATTHRICLAAGNRQAAVFAGLVAAMLPLTLLPIISWSVLMRVDNLALALTLGGILLAGLSFRRPALIYPALLVFVAAAFTKQNFLAGAVSMFPICLLRAPKHTLRAYAAGGALGLALIGLLQYITEGRFLLHVVAYAADSTNLAVALRETLKWLAGYPIFALLTLCAVIIAWRRTLAEPGRPSLLELIRTREDYAWLGFLTLYLLLTTAMLVTAGKTGAAPNYFLEWMACWCLWIGWLTGQTLDATPPARFAWLIPAAMLLQIFPVYLGVHAMRAQQFSQTRRDEWGALLERVRNIPGPLLSDDMVLVIQTGREVQMEPGILLEMAHTGQWNEQLLIDKLHAHYFGAVITAYDPGNPTFDARYLPKTQAAMLQAYPHVERFGDYRLRLAD